MLIMYNTNLIAAHVLQVAHDTRSVEQIGSGNAIDLSQEQDSTFAPIELQERLIQNLLPERVLSQRIVSERIVSRRLHTTLT